MCSLLLSNLRNNQDSLPPAIKVFSISELAHLILNYLDKTSILVLRETCRVFYDACTISQFFYKDVTRPTNHYLHHRTRPHALMMSPYWIRSLGLKETEPVFGPRTPETPYFRRALQEWPNLVSLRIILQWPDKPRHLEDAIVNALKLKATSALYSSLAKKRLHHDSLLGMSEMSMIKSKSLISEETTATLLATGMTTRLQQKVAPMVGTMKGLSHLELFATLRMPFNSDFGSLLEKLASCMIPIPMTGSLTAKAMTTTMTLPLLPDLVSFKLAFDHRRGSASVPWSSLLNFLNSAVPMLEELDLGYCAIIVDTESNSKPIDTTEPVIQRLRSLTLRSAISQGLAKRLIRSLPGLESLSIHSPDELWLQRPVVVANNQTAESAMISVFIITEETKAAEQAARKAAAVWTPFPLLKSLHLSLVSKPPFFTTLNPNWTFPESLKDLEVDYT